jgi:predicted nucleotidyltransferase
MPQSIILFGSAAKGEDIGQSDIDLFIESKEISISLEKFEKPLKRKISILFKENFRDLSKELKNNIVNGIKLYGFLRAY